ncbi:HlyD family type I secretion periplasmic adaptor subunit [Primorskyibacter sp. S187A]|uniref:HlyD family type I secretion periplasmic adaptor subunit n=1 Tax=Primorskyibacter sp. S187A TaxID=3415130 RepID=UPI003C7BE1C0
MSTKAFPMRAPMLVGLIALLALVGGFGSWAALSQISGAVIASGQIEVDQNRQVVQHPDGGVVATVVIDEADRVAAGDVLIRLDGTLLQSQKASVEAELFDLLARKARLVAERDGEAAVGEFDTELRDLAPSRPDIAELMEGQLRLFEARGASVQGEIRQLNQQSGQIDRQIEGLEAQRVALTRQLELIQKELGDQQRLLNQGLTQQGRVLALEREAARLEGQRGQLVAQVAQSRGQQSEIEVAVLRLASQRREEAITQLRDLVVREGQLREERAQLSERLDRLDIRAPVSGIVYDLSVFAQRAVIRPADPLLYIVPQDRPLLIAAQVAPIDIDEITLGQEVLLRFPALPSRETPEMYGEVQRISADAFVDDISRMPFYRAEIVLKEGEFAKFPEGTQLIPGMPVEAFIRTDDRTPLTYLVKPLQDYFARAFRES